VRLVADSFGWPFCGRRAGAWIGGLAAVLLLPLLFIPLLGYAIAATRAAEQDATQGPPAWSLTPRLFSDGLWVAVAIALTLLPFALLWGPVSDLLSRGVEPLIARTGAALLLALPWGLLALLHMPHATATFAATGDPRDMLDLAGAARSVRRDFSSWNLVAAAIVTAWAAGLACVGLLCVGIVPGIFYAILVSAHAAATLQNARAGSSPSAR
jgi:uncharacterized protein DUF4013